MKNSSICCGARSVIAALIILSLAAPLVAAKQDKRKNFATEDLTNFALSVALSQWLVGATAYIASDEERETYLRLTDDTEAKAFIEAFWSRRDDPGRPWPQEQLRGTFERRAKEADKLYTEGTYLGRRSDRGVIYVLNGPPGRIEYQQEPPPRRGTFEIWRYPKNAGPGLDLKRPRTAYFFMKKGARTVRHAPPSIRQRP